MIDIDTFIAKMPEEIKQFANLLLDAAEVHGVDPYLLAGMAWRESHAGALLRPSGPTGTGDFIPRKSGSAWFKYADPSTGLPPDGHGWGRGLMQLDYGAEHDWVMSNAWDDAATSIDKAATKLAGLYQYFQQPAGPQVRVDGWRLNGLYGADGTCIVKGWKALYGLQSQGPFPDARPLAGEVLDEAALAAYNAGTVGVLEAIAAGLPGSAPSSGNDYGRYIIDHANSWKPE